MCRKHFKDPVFLFIDPYSGVLQFVCVVWELIGAQRVTVVGAAVSSVRGDHSYEQ